METLNWLLNILKVAFGLGFVIFLHELGHFLLAKWNGVKVEKFSIGFGRTLLGFKRGETEYVLAAIPLGGFVRMLGEGPEEEEKSTDPRAFPNKPVGARMAIISAGVIMNVLLGMACFVYARARGMDEVPAKVGAVKAGGPAYAAGIRPGDEIVAIDDDRDVDFERLRLKVRLSRAGQKLRFLLERPGAREPIALTLEPSLEKGEDMPNIGIAPSESLTLAETPFAAPAGMADPPKAEQAGLKKEDKLVAIGPEGEPATPVETIDQLHRLLAQFKDRTLVATFDRPKAKGRPERVSATLPPAHLVDFGFRLTIGPVTAIQAGSPAAKAGFRAGDEIVSVDGDRDFDPMRLPSLCYEKARAGGSMTFEVARRWGDDGARTTVPIAVTPDDAPPWVEVATFPNEPLEVPGLGLAYPVRTKIAAVREGSPAAKAGLKAGDVISSLTFPPPPDDAKAGAARKGKAKPKEKARPVEFGGEKGDNWPFAFAELQLLPRRPVELTINDAKTPIALTPEPDPTWSLPYRGLRFRAEIVRRPPQGLAASVRLGWEDTVGNVLAIYTMLRSLVQQRVGTKALAGPIPIFQMAYASAASSFTELVYFLGILSINLAVLNFLPIPPLDGGQMVFLVAEKVRGRPLPPSAVLAGSWVGLMLVLCLMVFVIFQDFVRMAADWF